MVERCENFLDIVVAEALGVQRIDVRDLHGRLRDRAGLIHAEHVHMGQRLDAVHILHEHALARELQAAGRDGDARQQVKALRIMPIRAETVDSTESRSGKPWNTDRK